MMLGYFVRPTKSSLGNRLVELAVVFEWFPSWSDFKGVQNARSRVYYDTRRISELEWSFEKQDAQALTGMQKSIQNRLEREAAQH
jgi:hypothetical protein